MFKIILTCVVLSLTSSFASSDHNHDHHGHSKVKTSKRVSLDSKTKMEVINMLKANDELHTSFFNYDAKKVEKAAEKLKTTISKISNNEIEKVLSFSKGKLAKITSKNDRDSNNQNYHLVSMALIHIVNKYDVGKEFNSYSCPMVKKKWLQNSTIKGKTNNPYAPGMPNCGVKESNH